MLNNFGLCRDFGLMETNRGAGDPASSFGLCRDLGLMETNGGAGENRTRDGGFADPCLTTWLRHQIQESIVKTM